MCVSLISGEKNVSVGAESREGQAARARSQQQQQQRQHDALETFPPPGVTSGKFNFNSFLSELCVIVVLELSSKT